MEIKEGLFYTETHEWVEFTDRGTAFVGISDYAQNSMGDIAFVNLCDEGEAFTAGDVFGDIEAFKGVSELFAPVSGKILRVNEELFNCPGAINSKHYETWLVEFGDCTRSNDLMDSEAYAAFVE